MYMPINLTGGSYAHRSRPLAAQRTVNWWPQVQEGAGVSESILESFPGLSLFSAGEGDDRGIYSHRGTLYKITGTTLASVSSTGVRTTLATIPGTARCVIEGLKNSVIIVCEGDVYEWSEDTDTLTTASDVDFENPFSVAVLNNQAIYDGLEDRFCTSEVGVPLNIDGLDYATAESNADKLVRVYAFDSKLYLLGQKTTEIWWNSGVGHPPFDRQEGGIYEVGCGARNSVAHTDQAMYFLGDDRVVYSISQAGLNGNIIPSVLVREFSNYGAYSDAVGWTMKFHKQSFYFLKFPAANKTWVYPEGGVWFQMNSTMYDLAADLGRYRGNGYAFCHNKHLFSDEDGNILELDEDVFTENGDTIIRVRDTAPIHGGLLGKPGKNVELSELTVVMEVGTGDVATPTPQIMLSLSTDGGRTFGAEMSMDIGGEGEYLREVRFSGLNAVGNTIIARIIASDPVYYSIHSAAIEINVGI